MNAPRHDAILVDHQLEALVGTAIRPADGAPPIDVRPGRQIQPTSLDLRLGPTVHEIRAGFLPAGRPVEERLQDLEVDVRPLDAAGTTLERGRVYLVPLDEELALPDDLFARFNPRSSAGRCDVFTRVVVPGVPRFDRTPRGWHGRPWLEIAPLSFPIHVARGDSLCQVRVARGAPALDHGALAERYRETPLCHDASGPLAPDAVRFDGDGGLELRVGLRGRDPCAWRAAGTNTPVRFAERGAHDPRDFWQPVRAETSAAGEPYCVLEPGHFYLFASRERLRLPPDLAAEMLPVDVGIGELRNNYAGFFDAGFGWGDDAPNGTPAVLEVRAHDVPFVVSDGQILFRLRYFRTSMRPTRLYGEGRESYGRQDLTLARTFRAPQ
jgi:dCTP deaminase